MTVSVVPGDFENDIVEVGQNEIPVADEESGQERSLSQSEMTTYLDEEDDEHDVGETLSSNRELGAPQRRHSLSSFHSTTDQVLGMDNRLDLSDSSAIMSRLDSSSSSSSSRNISNGKNNRELVSRNSNNHHRRQGSESFIHVARLSTRRMSSRLSFRADPPPSRRQLSRRPSLHETHHESEQLFRGEFLYYLYSFAILGTSIRIFMGRLFGGDCENPGGIQDFLSPLSEKICVTSDGTTMQHGGALFIDLPANMLGSFMMGLVSSVHPEGGRVGSKLPWLHKDHPLQKHQGLHHAIKVGLCGSLTTFSSWNTQMVIMLDGTDTELGSQIASALFGYVIGLACAVWAFTFGGRVHEWTYDWSNGVKENSCDDSQKHDFKQYDDDDDDEEQPTSWDSEDSHMKPRVLTSSNTEVSSNTRGVESPGKKQTSRWYDTATSNRSLCTIFFHKVVPFLIAISLLVLYGLGHGLNNIQFYRELFASSILTPVGVHLRWKLAAFNGRGIGSRHRFEWVPFGTLSGNLVAVVVSVVFAALYIKFNKSGTGDHPYVLAVLFGMKAGLAGSLSTVSSMAKETSNLATQNPTHAKAYIYSGATIVISMFLGLLFYSPIMRYTDW